ncbi:MAG: tRNA 5-methoxyuridine(34)/uridine 5-oxyacetic acid(34) synthase CmoB [Gammaproteobacteria bacterium]|nr:tRNA 5-methoxyuridine(34)/uridine 5-oxyacetic acid(34) synthase CmoB [Gammaproteobacteria bacterium]
MNLEQLDYDALWQWLAQSPLAHWLETVPALCEERLLAHGDLPRWLDALAALPELKPDKLDLNAPCLHIGEAKQLNEAARTQLAETLMAFHPWRKGPFCPYGLHLDTEWRSDWKWARLAEQITLQDKLVLDVGSGNGYYGWRMLGAGAQRVIGIDPTISYVMQFAAMQKLIGPQPMQVLPLALEALPPGQGAFDTVFSMGVIYHRRDHMEHLTQLHQMLKPAGELIIEGLVIPEGHGEAIYPASQGDRRYAKMKNVHTVPSVASVSHWLTEAGFKQVRLLDLSPTTVEEQRATPWMHFESLRDYLDPRDPSRTVEGYPAPLRAMLHASIP